MPLWAWAAFVALILYYGLRLRRAYAEKEVKYGPAIYTEDSSTFAFIFLVLCESVAFIFLLIFFGYIIFWQAT